MEQPNRFDHFGNTLNQLLRDVLALRADVIEKAHTRLQSVQRYQTGSESRVSAENLAHYLALRSQDLRDLQVRLSNAGLSSLGRGEPHVLANLDRVIEILSRAVGYYGHPKNGVLSGEVLSLGHAILRTRTNRLFGAKPEHRGARIMVTLPTEAGDNYALVRSLFDAGMDCARINCAHDDAVVWKQMVDNVRRAEQETQRNCKILMDLAGHKIRTGEIVTKPAVKHIKPQKDGYGKVVEPTIVRLRQSGHPGGQTATNGHVVFIPPPLFANLQSGDRLALNDGKGRHRELQLLGQDDPDDWLAVCQQSTYLLPGTELELYRKDSAGNEALIARDLISSFKGKAIEIRVKKGEQLYLTRDAVPGEPARFDMRDNTFRPTHISCTHKAVFDCLKPGDSVWIDDGKIGCVVKHADAGGALLEIEHAGPKGVRLREGKGINFPDTPLELPPLSDKDLADLDFVCRHADMVGLSYVNSLDDLLLLIEELNKRQGDHVAIIAKIETKQAVSHLPDIILGMLGRHEFGVMIARGDLAIELGSERMAETQEEILWLCEAAHVPVIWATQVLETLAKRGITSRPEITDAAMSVRAECVMLNKGPYIATAVRVLADILTRMQSHQAKKVSRLSAMNW